MLLVISMTMAEMGGTDMKTTKKTVTRITIELDEQEAMILAKLIGNIGGIHEWRTFTGQLYTELLDRLGRDDLYEFGSDVIKQYMILGD